jgi:hypothetical protein
MDKHLLKRFQAERARRFDEAAQKLLEQSDVETAKKYLDWAETSTKLLAASQQAARRKWTLIIIVVCVLLVGLAWTLRISFTHLTLDVTTGNVRMTLRKAWIGDQQLAVEKVFINNLTDIAAPGLNLAVTADQGLSWMALQGTGITLNKLTLSADARVELKVRENELQWVVKMSSLSGTLQVQNAELTIKTENNTETTSLVDKIPPEPIRFQAQTSAAPIELRFVTKENWRLRNLQVQALDFVEENPPGEGKFQSVIRSGKMVLQENSFTQELQEADELTLKNPQSRQLELSNAENGVRVLFDGSAAQILIGSQDFQQNLTPTYFEYLARQKWLTVFWGAVVFLSGLIWRIRDTIFA